MIAMDRIAQIRSWRDDAILTIHHKSEYRYADPAFCAPHANDIAIP
ncbi:MAG TPA: hypothetical protein VJS63_07355 [Bradyrhizobium sp.]|nr:hypothetical protein [Bradyrhizobium sp.]